MGRRLAPGNSLGTANEPLGTVGPLGRRAFLQAIAAGAVLLAPPLARGSRAAPAAAQGEPRAGGTYRVLTNEQIPSLDAALAYNYLDWWLSYQGIYNRLYRFDREGQLQPDLAEGMPRMSADGLSYAVTLRSGVTFHNGREVTADDVKFSFDRTVWPGLESPGSSFLTNVAGYEEMAGRTVEPDTPYDPSVTLTGVTVVDPRTVSFTLKQPQAVFAAILGVTTFGVAPKQEVIDAGRDWGTKVVVGTGPFRFVEWSQGERIVLERNPDYFRPDRPYLERVELALNVQGESGTLRWESGEAEMIPGASPADLARIRSDPTLSARLREGPSMVIYYLDFASNAAPFDTLQVRQAVAMAIDKATLAARSQNGVPIDGYLIPGYPQTDPAFASEYPYDPDRAKTLLQEAGVTEGAKTTFWSGGTTPQLGELIQADLTAVGFDPELLVLEGSSLDVFEPRLKSGELSLRTWGYGPDYPDGSAFVSTKLLCTPQSWPSAWCDQEITDLADQADALAIDDPQRTELLRRIQRIAVNERVYLVPLYARNALILSQDWVHGDEPDPLGLLPRLEEVWMDER